MAVSWHSCCSHLLMFPHAGSRCGTARSATAIAGACAGERHKVRATARPGSSIARSAPNRNLSDTMRRM
eukprot:10045073-Alexandrium_andersonii.AAC.1